MALEVFIVSEGQVPQFGVRTNAVITVVAAEAVLGQDGTTIVKKASQVACEQVAAQYNMGATRLSALAFSVPDTFDLSPEPTVYTASQVVIELPEEGDEPDPV